MKEDVACQRILAEMIEFEIVTEENEDAAWNYLKRVYVLGHEEGETQPSKRKQVVQFSIDGKPMKIWDAAKHAASFYKIAPQGIHNAASGKRPTAAGFKWKYVNNK